MILSSFAESNCVLVATHEDSKEKEEDGMDRSGTAICALAGKGLEGNPCTVLCFKMTADELREVSNTGRVWVVVHGERFPMLSLFGYKPF